MATDKNWATDYLINPLIAPDPSDETGPGTHFTSTFAPVGGYQSPPPSATLKEDRKNDQTKTESRLLRKKTRDSANPFRRTASESSRPASNVYSQPLTLRGKDAYPSPPTSASPSREKFSSGQAGAADLSSDGRNGTSAAKAPVGVAGRRRGGSLTERFPGDKSHRPLDMLKRDNKLAHRAPHLQRQSIPGADTIDRLDGTGGNYHHEGPYDAALAARNVSPLTSPVAAVAASNKEALKATPKEYILDAIQGHRPLDGVAIVPPGMPDRFGRVYNYEEGTDMMRENGGNYKRWPGVTYLPEDLKGKGVPSFTIERALKSHNRSGSADGTAGIEMTDRRRRDGEPRDRGSDDYHRQNAYIDGDMRRRNSTGKRLSDGLRKKIGSLRRR